MSPEKSYNFHVEPRDLLFLRDARPMEASDAGLGANWPRPDQIWNAFINAFHARWPEHQALHHKSNKDDHPDSSFRFGGLKTVGPFPTDLASGEIYFPCPRDLSADDDGNLHPMTLVPADDTNLPQPLKFAFASSKLGKAALPEWLSKEQYDLYLQGKPIFLHEAPASCVHDPESCVSQSPSPAYPGPSLYDTEHHTGIAIDPETGTAAERKLYQAQYLRFRPGVRMAVQASCMIVDKDRDQTDVFAQVCKEANIPLILGGQQGMAYASQAKQGFALPENHLSPTTADQPVYLRWILLSPAVFPEIPADSEKGIARHPGGWLPTWVEQSLGMVMLPKGKLPKRDEFRSREAWRQAIAKAPKFHAPLVAARIGKPLAFSGWDLQTGPKPTRLAVPAGSVYVFECKDVAEAKALATALSWNGGTGCEVRNRRSTFFGEKGFGIGVCSIINQSQL